MIGGLLKGFFSDHDVQEQMTRDSGLDYVIAHPTRTTNGKYARKADVTRMPSSISRADLADFLVESCTGPTWLTKAVHLGG